MKKSIIFFILLSICLFCQIFRGTADLSKELLPLQMASTVSDNEAVLFDYLCRSRYWTVEEQHNRILAVLNEYGELNLLSWRSPSSICFVFKTIPQYHFPTGTLQRAEAPHVMSKSKQMQTLPLSDNVDLIINDHEQYKTARMFRKKVVSYFNDIAQDINENALELRLQAEDSIKTGFGSFGISDVMVSCSKSCVTQDNSIRGWINLGVRDCIYAILFDAKSGKRLGVNKAFRSRQYVGFDEDANKRFFFELPIFLDGDGEMIETRIVLCSSVDNRPFFTTNTVLQTWVK